MFKFLGILLFLHVTYCFGFNESYSVHTIDAPPNRTMFVTAIRKNTNEFTFKLNEGPVKGDFVAQSEIIIHTNNTGWAFQKVVSNGSYPDEFQAYWAGYLDVAVAKDLTKASFNSRLNEYCKRETKYCQQLKIYVHTNLYWMKKRVIKYSQKDPFWYQVYLLLWQIRGHEDAYEGKPIKSSSKLSLRAFKKLVFNPFGIYLLQIFADLGDIEEIFKKPGVRLSSTIEHCSALIKLLPNNSDIYASHVTWTGYSTMLRVAKFYDTPVRTLNISGASIIPGRTMSWSGYPGQSNSMDDFYTIGSSKLVTIETTNGIYNKTLKRIMARGLNTKVLEYMRVLVANRLSKTGTEWIRHFSRYNSGTYNNQWMVVDYKNFHPGQPLPDHGVLFVAEQIPGKIVHADFTKHLKDVGYWASYNIPSFPEIFNTSGYVPLETKYPAFYSYSKSARAMIFRRNQSSVVDLTSMMKLMRYNNYKNDPLSQCNCTPPYLPTQTISSRYDLITKGGKYPLPKFTWHAGGATDMKVTNSSMIGKSQFIGISGPTYDQVPVFQWSKSGLANTTLHLMQPDCFNFPPVLTPYKMT